MVPKPLIWLPSSIWLVRKPWGGLSAEYRARVSVAAAGRGDREGVQRCQGTEGQRDIWLDHTASNFHGLKVVQPRAEREPRAPRKTRRAHKQSHVASGPGGAGLRAGGSSGNKEPGQRPGINTAPRQRRSIPGVRRDTRPFPAPAPSASPGTPRAHPRPAVLHISSPHLS